MSVAHGLLIALSVAAMVARHPWSPSMRVGFCVLLIFVYAKVLLRDWRDGSLKRNLAQIHASYRAPSARRSSVAAKLETAAVFVGSVAAIFFVL